MVKVAHSAELAGSPPTPAHALPAPAAPRCTPALVAALRQRLANLLPLPLAHLSLECLELKRNLVVPDSQHTLRVNVRMRYASASRAARFNLMCTRPTIFASKLLGSMPPGENWRCS